MSAADGQSPVIVRSPVTNAGIVRRDGRSLLIGCVPPADLQRSGIRPESVEWLLLTHHHRNAADGLEEWMAIGAGLAVPESERALFERAEGRWADESFRVHAYHFHPSNRTLRRNIPVAHGLTEREPFAWRGVSIPAVSTPGPSSGGMSFVVEDGGRRTAFVGELICADGKLRDYHLLQGARPMPDGMLVEYHGFGERAGDCVASLERVLALRPDMLVPSFGPAIRKPSDAVAALKARVEAVRRNYHSISAGRWYFPNVWPDVPDITADLRKRCRPLPSWVAEIGGTSRCVVADDGSALLMDCAGDVPQRVRDLQSSGRLGRIQGLWITHYHDDHVDKVNAFIAAQPCDLIVHHTMEDLLRRPEARWMPCVDPRPIRPDRVTTDGETWGWRGFRLTAFDLPGQTFYDAALLVEHGSERVLFVGDSFTPGGLDDYCALNRNLLGPGLGYERCLALLDRLGPDVLLVNQHVGGAFVFSRAEVAHMRRTLDERRRLFSDLLDWDNPNFGLDPQWVRLDPYYRAAQPGETLEWSVVIRNHAAKARRFSATLCLPPGWESNLNRGSLVVPSGAESRLTVSAKPAADAVGRQVVGLAVQMERRRLGDIAEALVDLVHPSASRAEGEGRRE